MELSDVSSMQICLYNQPINLFGRVSALLLFGSNSSRNGLGEMIGEEEILQCHQNYVNLFAHRIKGALKGDIAGNRQ